VDFENIYNCTFRYVYRFFYYKSVNPASIEDLSHEVFLRFYKKYGTQHFEETEAKRILFGFSSNIYKEWVREQVKEKRAEFLENYDYDVQVEEDLDDFHDGDNAFELKLESQKKIVFDAMSKLNPKIREILECRFVHGMSRKMIAEKMGIKEKDVHTYQKRGIKYLKKIIGESEGNPPVPLMS
jgi:RNA polymerase sigma factor (sigma-70 family)